MPWWGRLLIALASFVLLSTAVAFLLRRQIRLVQGATARRVEALPLPAKLSLIHRLILDPRIPLRAKVLLPLIILYLAMPLDLVPDFIPVVGHFDDLLIVLGAAFLLRRAVPRHILEENLKAVEEQSAREI